MQAVFHTLKRVAPFDLNVLLTGSSGVGKTRLAQDIHRVSPRADKPFVTLECASIPDTLLESELFGHTEGAFTGAVTAREGAFVRADGGTLLLDEVGAASPALQVALLRALEEGRITPLGDFRSREVDVRIVATTSLSLADEVAAGRFRADLFYRLAVVVVELPTLAQRPDDILALADAMLQHVINEWKLPPRTWSVETRAALREHPWPGNLRELDNAVKRAAALAVSALIMPDALPFYDAQAAHDADTAGGTAVYGAQLDGWSVGQFVAIHPDVFSLRVLQQELETMAIARALDACHGNQTEAARLLDISRRKLVYALQNDRASDPVEPGEV